MTGRTDAPVALGGIGGSGTRLGAAILQALGYFIGDDLNGPLDNLWFTLLFKRRSVLLEPRAGFEALYATFAQRMRGSLNPSDEQRERIVELASIERHHHPREWLAERAGSFLASASSAGPPRKFGWKEPNTHIVLDRLFDVDPALRYIHFLRNPLYMAYSDNQAQLHNWGPVLLDREIAVGPADSLAYWCAAHRRITGFSRLWPDRVLIVDYDRLVIDPQAGLDAIMRFLGADRIDTDFVEAFLRERPVREPLPVDPGHFRPADLRYVATLGYKAG